MAAHVIGKVQALQGIVQVRDQNGKIHSLMVGDELLEGQVVLTGSGHLTIAFADGGTANIGAGQTVAITAELSAHFFPGADESHLASVASADAAAHAILNGADLNQLLATDATAAGVGVANEGHTFVQLLRIVEAVDLGPGGTTSGGALPALTLEQVFPLPQAPANHTPEVTVPQAGGADTTVFEGGLPARGSEPAGSHVGDSNVPVTASGTVSFTSLDGVQSVSLGGHVLTGTNATFTDATGSLTASYTYDAVHGTGSITYSYTLLDNTSGDNTNVTLPVVVTDPQGDANATANLVINVVDDVPTANPGSNSGAEGATLTGNVLTDGAQADVFGADGPVAGGGVVGVAHGSSIATAVTTGVETAIAGSFGTLTVHADGSYTYVGNPNTVPPEGATDSFVYTIQDGDGDLSTSTLTIALTDAGLSATNPTITVDEAALSTGSNPSSPAETAGGTLGVTNAVSYAFTAGHDGAGSHGTLTLNPDGSYSYTLTSAEDSGAVQGANTVNGAETFFYTATDANGNTVDGTIVVNIKDDVPTAFAGSNSGAEGSTLSGNVLTDGAHADVFGADGPAAGGGVVGVAHGSDTATAVTTGVETAIAGSFGTLVLHANGTYTYTGTPNVVPPAGATDSFVYTIKDGDGDLSTSTLSINLTNTSLSPTNPTITVDEAALSTGSNPSSTAETAGGTLGVAGAVSYVLTDAGGGTGSHGTLTLNANGSYSYTLAAAENSGAVQGANTVSGAETFHYRATDALGNTVDGTIVVNIKDDVPTAHDDPGFTTTVGSPVTVDVTGNDVVGADTAGVWALGTGPSHGAITDNGDGTFKYTPNAGYLGTDSFTYTLTDHDGDVSTATATITVSSNGGPTIVVTDNNADVAGQVTVNEAGLPTGTLHDGSNSTTGTIVVTAPDGLASIDFGATNVTAAQLAALDTTPVAIATPDGTLTLTGFDGTNISYTYAIDHPQTGPNAASTSVLDTLSLTVHDSTGTVAGTATTTFGATILDDAPLISADNLAMPNVAGTYAGHFNFTVGADTQPFASSFGASSDLTWTDSRPGYTFTYDPLTQVGTATFVDVTNTVRTFFTVSLSGDASGSDTYNFHLVTPDPTTVSTNDALLAGVTGGSNLPTYTIDGSHFGNQFNLVLSGYSDAHPLSSGGDTITISSTSLGVGDNVMQGNAGDVLRFDVQPISGSTGSLAQLTVNVDGSGGWKATDYVNATVHYTDGSTDGGLNVTTGPFHVQWGADQSVTLTFDPNKTVDYIDLNPYGSSASFKIDGVSGKYTVETFPQDYQLHFGITGTDADQDAASTSFAVAVNADHNGTYTITGTSGVDTLYGTPGNDTFNGNGGSDTFAWHPNDHGVAGSPANDMIINLNSSSFSSGGDKLDLRDLLQGENYGGPGGAGNNLDQYLNFSSGGPTSTVISVSSTGNVNAAGGAGIDQVITLQGVDLTAGNTHTTDQIINTLLTNGNLLKE